MTRRLIWGMVALLALLTLLGTGLATRLEREPVQRREPPRAEARRNPYLALERFTARMGGSLERASAAGALDRLSAGGTVFLDRQRQQWLPAERLRHLLNWVEEGGYLIAVAEEAGVEDSLLDSLGVVRPEKSEPFANRGSRVLPVALGSSPPLFIDATRQVLVAGDRQPEWTASRGGRGAQILHYRVGRGHVTVAVGLDRQLGNDRIGEQDHAELYWTLLSRYDHAPHPNVLLLSRLRMPTLSAWLLENAWEAGVSAAVFLLLWLWRVVPRFGTCQPDAPPVRRELREHLAAVGRYLWRAGALPVLLAPAREHFHTRLALRHPGIAALPGEAQASALAALSRRPATQIAAALHGPADTPHTFSEALRTLHKLERDL